MAVDTLALLRDRDNLLLSLNDLIYQGERHDAGLRLETFLGLSPQIDIRHGRATADAVVVPGVPAARRMPVT